MPDSDPNVLFDAGAYRALAATGDAAAAGAVARHLAAAERARGIQAGASPFVLWELLAASVPRAPRPGVAPPAGPPRDAVARAALAACVAHCARPDDAPAPAGSDGAPPRSFVLAPDPDAVLCLAVTGAVPAELTAWSEYLASLAAEVAADPTAERVARLAVPLRHVRARARQAAEDFADEVQDAIAAAYEAAAPGWDPSAGSVERQRSLAGDAAGGAVSFEGAAAVETGGLLDAVLSHDPLLRAVAVSRARRARRLAAGKSAHAEMFDDAVSPALLADAAAVVERFPAGVALLRELLRRVVAGELDLATRAGRRWFWDAQVASAAGGAVVSGNPLVVAARAGAADVRTVEEHVGQLAGRVAG